MMTGLRHALASGTAWVLLVASAAACGPGEAVPTPWGRTEPLTRAGRVPERVAQAPRGPAARPPLPGQAPVETFLAGTRLPERIAGQRVTVRFRSNAEGAAFECRVGNARSFSACSGGASHTFDGLAHGQSHQLEARARAKDGRADATPLVVAFVVDQAFGERVPDDATTGPDNGGGQGGGTPVIPPRPDLSGGGEAGGRRLLLGSFYAVDVPGPYLVTSYSTTKTYDGDFRLVRLMGRHAGSAYRNEPCTRTFEREITGPDGSLYCDSTPRPAELATAYAQPLPYNHAELVLGSESTTYEKILVAAFDSEADPNETRLTLQTACSGAAQSGWASVPGLEDFFGELEQRESLAWCLTRAQDGEWWYVGMFRAQKGTGPRAPRMAVVYSANARLGVFSGQSFAARVGETMRALLEPLSPVP